MFVELVDALRCPNPHAESWLVAAAERTEHRHIVQGTLGCPVCRATYPIVGGVADFRGSHAGERIAPTAPDADRAAQLAAFLDLTDATGFAVLVGAWGAHGALLSEMAGTPLLLVDPPASVIARAGVSILRAGRALPLAAGAARGIALDDAGARDDVRAASAVRAVRPSGRFVASASVRLPLGIRELARNEELVVGEREATASPIVTLHVRRGGAP